MSVVLQVKTTLLTEKHAIRVINRMSKSLHNVLVVPSSTSVRNHWAHTETLLTRWCFQPESTCPQVQRT